MDGGKGRKRSNTLLPKNNQGRLSPSPAHSHNSSSSGISGFKPNETGSENIETLRNEWGTTGMNMVNHYTY